MYKQWREIVGRGKEVRAIYSALKVKLIRFNACNGELRLSRQSHYLLEYDSPGSLHYTSELEIVSHQALDVIIENLKNGKGDQNTRALNNFNAAYRKEIIANFEMSKNRVVVPEGCEPNYDDGLEMLQAVKAGDTKVYVPSRNALKEVMFSLGATKNVVERVNTFLTEQNGLSPLNLSSLLSLSSTVLHDSSWSRFQIIRQTSTSLNSNFQAIDKFVCRESKVGRDTMS